ncbi:MAG: tetratricopeptide repeat protein [Gammaproteobacteria bacterium]|nr:tetratricopeptide repeat protein [Gammaproteobacteria bacterium]MDH3450504.1 tetratricopeptide repeat protein [Gammaproteobacteria bacterium]
MPLIRFSGLAVLLLLASSCALEPQYNQYQFPDRPNQPGQDAVAELQHSASEALRRDAYQQAIDYLQRAIKIDPRNPHSWHRLAEVYWRSGDFRRCVEMIERSFSYSDSDDRLDRVNRKLRQKCQQG